MSKKHKDRPEEPRSFEVPRMIDVDDKNAVKQLAKHWGTSKEDIRLAVEKVGPNATAVLLYVTAPLP